MKICWDNLEKLRYSKCTGKWYTENMNTFIYKDECKYCYEPFLGNKTSKYCCIQCTRKDIVWNKGKKCPEHSKKLKGRKRPEHSKRMIGKGNPAYGTTLPEERKLKIRASLIEGDYTGKRHPNWRGGISKAKYCLIFRDKEWREYIYYRDKEKECWNPQCEKKGTRTALHHIDYNKKNCSTDNIIKVCNICNTQANFNRGWWKAFYKEIMGRRGYAK